MLRLHVISIRLLWSSGAVLDANSTDPLPDDGTG